MRVLVTDGAGLLGSRLVGALSAAHRVSVLDGDPREREVAARETVGVDAVVCGVPLAGDGVATTCDPTTALDRASRGIYNLITTATSAKRFVLLSSLRSFERYPLDHHVTEYWAPRPTTEPADLVPFTAEGVVREAARVLPLRAVCLRLGMVVDGQGAPDPRAVHVDDVVRAVELALAFDPGESEPRTGWWLFHVVGRGRTRFPLGLAGRAGSERRQFQPARGATLGYAPVHDVAGDAAIAPAGSPSPRRLGAHPGGAAQRVVIFGAGGPLAAATAGLLEHDHVLRLCDKRPLAEIVAAGRPQSRGAPLPKLPGPPHEIRTVDVTDYGQVLEATRGMEAVVNMSVVRHDLGEAFRVNTLGAYNVVRAALACGVRRIVQTGPQQMTDAMPGGYWSDFDLTSTVPPRPGIQAYFHTKFLGQELMRVFAQEHELEIPTLLFGPFTNPDDCEPDQLGCYPFKVSWADAAEAVRGALRAPCFPYPFEVFNIAADLPHGKYRVDRAKQLLHWQPRDSLDVHWRRSI